ncbi:AMP-binding protein [Streptomyces albidoflavus]|uniref:AMP-binding protein n=1 Tax=Streptomyces albidoflavus TaxID=1886 RepID=UPI00101E53C8|nr:AMP-binding protein [Streptomyces albidoflavus]RZD80815.1 amino acid adenylation protein [Streptomyces albidoflavus]RZD98385.1 amino acid adenylation protein [Streptomyces albidoflavus]
MVANAEAAVLPPWSNDSAGGAGTPPALGDLLVAPARKWPDRTAIDDGTDSHTFAGLERGALALASRLAGLGVGPGDRVVVLAAKRAVMPMIIMAVWKRGAVYVPLDAAEPAPRLHSLLTRLAPAAVLALDDREPALDAPWLGKEQLDEALAGADAAHATVAHRPEDPAYIVFASGATGEPQGAEIGVAALLAHFGGHNEVLRLTAESRVLSLSPFHFDVSLLDTVLPLSVGAFVHQFRSLPAGAVIRSVLARQRLTHLLAVTVMLTQITGDGRQITPAKMPSLELVMTGAQVCEPAVLRPWLQNLPQVRLVQAFGPPEATIFSLTHELGPSDIDRTTACPVGRPLRGTRARLVRDGAELREPGEVGELWVGGPQVMRGYFDQPGETARTVVEADGTRWFRTGDLCSRDPDGTLVLHRYAEEIAWLAGRRTHLAEIRRAALECPGAEGAAVAVVPRHQREVLALVLLAKDRRVVADAVEHLRGALPEPLRPALLGWAPTEAAASEAGEPELIQRLATAAEQSNSHYFALTADGAVETLEEVEL